MMFRLLLVKELLRVAPLMGLGPLPNWMFVEYRRECAGLMVVKCFVPIAVNGKIL